jgi:hypothetical protein
MLIDVDTRKPILSVPYRARFDAMTARLSPAEFDAIVSHINALIDGVGADIATAGWLPGNDWTGTHFQPIYDKAARRSYDQAAKFFGLLVWHTVMQRPETWASGRYQKGGKDIGSRTYFRVHP